jgi:uncharacterized protein (TIRG00374 family)
MKIGWRGALGIAISALLLAYVAYTIQWREAIVTLRHASIPLLVLSAIAATGIFPLRARRWKTILEPVSPTIRFMPLWRSTAIGMMVNNVVPARAGEFARAYALSREEPSIPFSTAFASLAVDRLFDAIVVLGLMFGAMAMSDFPSANAGPLVSRAAIGGVGLVVVLLVGLYVFVFFPDRIIALFELLARRAAPRIEARGRDVLRAFAEGLGVIRHPVRFVAVLWWAVLHWLLNAFAFWIAFRAVGITASFGAALFVQGIIAMGVSVPSSPGFVGVFEKAGQFGLAVYGVSSTIAGTWAIGFHVLSFIPITVIGSVYFARAGLSMDEITTAGGAVS